MAKMKYVKYKMDNGEIATCKGYGNMKKLIQNAGLEIIDSWEE